MRTIALKLDPETRRKLELLAEITGYQRELLVAEAVRRFVEVELEAVVAIQAAERDREQADPSAKPKAPPLPENWKIIV
ncbi:hypothetical protein LJB82_03585 [Desulfovibrio sp. OttesenSCG-928-M16]|nr:hypothetical protein [Desulfovibrio sp. OttesenSCG-928-M16]